MICAIYESKTFTDVYKGIEFDLVIKFEEEYIPLEDILLDNDIDDISELYRRLDNCDAVYFCAHMEAWYNGIHLSDDYLGVCYYDSYDQFINNNDYFSDMKNNVMQEGYAKLKELKDVFENLNIEE